MEEVKIRAPRTVIGDFIVGVNAMKAAIPPENRVFPALELPQSE